jgi:hypothetical protein
MQRSAKILALQVALWIGALPLFAQLQPGGNPYHTAFEAQVLAQAQSGATVDALSLFLCGHPDVDAGQVDRYRQALERNVNDILADARPQSRADALFRGLRTRMFAHYAPIADLHDVFSTGAFNCVSATALMAVVYTEAGLGIEIQEQPRHVYLYAHEGDHRLRIETTAADFGAIRESKGKSVSGKSSRAHSAQHIDLIALAGLQYYNQGLSALDNGAPVTAMDAFRKAHLLYPSARVQEMLPVAAAACEQAGLDALLQHNWAKALACLERAAVVSQDFKLDAALSAAVLARAEQAVHLADMLQVLRAYAAWRPSLCAQAGLNASYADALLASAVQGFENEEGAMAFGFIAEFERLHAEYGAQPDPAIAAAAYQAGCRAAIRANDMPLAEQCLLMGMQFAPSDSRFKSQLATFSQQ